MEAFVFGDPVHAGRLRRQRARLQIDHGIENRVVVGGIEDRADAEIADVDLRTGSQPDAPLNAAHLPVILILEVTARAITQHAHGDLIFSRA